MSITDTSGANGDGSKSLARESKFGISVGALASTLALGLVEWLGTIDFSTLPTFASTLGALLVGQLAGLITAWATRNRKARAVR